MVLVASHIARLTQVILAAELSTRYDFRGAPREQLEQIARTMMLSETRRDRERTNDALTIAEAVWRHLRPELRRVVRIMNAESLSDQYIDDVILEKVFPNDSPRYEPGRK